MPVFVVNPHPGLLVRGNIDLTARPVVRNADGSYSTVRSVSYEINLPGRPKAAQLLIPTVVGNKVVSNGAALNAYRSTGKHLGIFDTVGHVNAYSQALHVWQANYYKKKAGIR